MSHAIQRALQRYGVRLTLDDLMELTEHLPKAVLLRKQKDGSEIRMFNWNGTVMIGVTDPDRKRIVTFLPHNAKAKFSRKARVNA